jgi:actin related protein 2/3 complex, subunit 1A/1B
VTLTWTSEEGLIAAGHDCQPTLFKGSPHNGWKMIASLDDASSRSATLSPTATGSSASGSIGRSSVGRLNNEAFNRFKNADSRGATGAGGVGGAGLVGAGFPGSPGGMLAVQSGGDLLTVHQNTITSVRPYTVGADGNVSRVSTSGVDGRLVIWQVSGGVPAVAGLTGRIGGMHLR